MVQRYSIDAANPRQYSDDDDATKLLRGNINGHIIRFRENADDVKATEFVWDIFLFGAEADALSDVNLSGLTDNNDFSSPEACGLTIAVYYGFKPMTAHILTQPTV